MSGILLELCELGKQGLRTPGEEIAFTARPKIHSQIFRYGRSIFCLPHRPNFSDIFDLCLHWVFVVSEYCHRYTLFTFSWIFQGLNKKIRWFLTLSSKKYAIWLIFEDLYLKLMTSKQFVQIKCSWHVLDMLCSCNFLVLNS